MHAPVLRLSLVLLRVVVPKIVIIGVAFGRHVVLLALVVLLLLLMGITSIRVHEDGVINLEKIILLL